jgi:di/tricarboxylate transporter
MTAEGWLAVGILLVAAALFVRKPLPLEVTALGIPVALFATGLLDVREALSGFSNQAVIAIGSFFVVGAALREAGVTTLFARGLQRVGGTSETGLILAIMGCAAAVSAFMSNAAVVAVLLPAVLTLSRRTAIAPSRLLIPLAFATVLGGNLSAIGTAPNLLLAAESRARGEAIGIFDFAVVGLPIVLAGVAIMATAGRRLLPVGTTADHLREGPQAEEAAESHGLGRNLFRMKVVASSKLRGRTVADAGLRRRYGLQIVRIMRPRRLRRVFLDATPGLVLATGDELYLEGSDEDAWRFAEDEVVQFGLAGPDEIEHLLGRGLVLAEIALAPRSALAGSTVRGLEFRNRYGLNVLSAWRQGAAVREGLIDLSLEAGDALLVSGSADHLRRLSADPDFVVLTDLSATQDLGRAPLAFALLLLGVLPAIAQPAWLPLSALAAAVLMVATGCLPMRRAQQAVDLKVLFVIIGTVPLGLALDRHGIGDAVASLVPGVGPSALLAVLFLVAAVMAATTSNASAAAILGPIAAGAAQSAGVPVDKSLLAVAYGCSCAFVMPYHQWNLLVAGPGGYRPRDFLRGLPVSAAAAPRTSSGRPRGEAGAPGRPWVDASSGRRVASEEGVPSCASDSPPSSRPCPSFPPAPRRPRTSA